MTPNCSQSLDNGKPCNAPAMIGTKFCRHHDPQRPQRLSQQKAPEHEPLTLPDINDKQCALVAINVIIQALASGRIRRSVAQTLLCAINSATRLMDQILEEGEAGITYEDPLPQPIALAAAGASREVASPVAPKLPLHAFKTEVDPSTARIVKELLAQTHQLAKAQSGLSRL